ncbi:MAG: SprT-like domain-containing protein [Akkermansiaceae bacterium]
MLYRDDEATNICARRLRELSLENLAERVNVVWNSRMRSTAGRAFYADSKIELNPKLREISEDEVRRTLLHELAHLMAHERYGRGRFKKIAPHGLEWQAACAELGLAGETATHRLPLPRRSMTKKWRYSCPSCGEGFERVRRIKRASGCYNCCRTKNGGRYHREFRLVESAIAEA